ncbi:MAG TPA: SLC13 family permease, partial [Gammaproteobacteria bacterium]|nr:SLC13 family permease [Gammaproteobacteria bacterium]
GASEREARRLSGQPERLIGHDDPPPQNANGQSPAHSPRQSLRRDYLLWTFVAAFVVLIALAPGEITGVVALVNWPTIATLLGLMILTKGIERSGALHGIARAVVRRMASERRLAFFLVCGSALAAMVLTNDIALFVVVPLTLGVGEFAQLPLRRLVTFEALAVNAGSLLTPIGNPQNIFLWQKSGVEFGGFVAHMLPPFLIVGILLLVLVGFAFSPRPIRVVSVDGSPPLHKPLLLTAAILYAPFVVLADLHHPAIALGAVALVFLLAFPRLLRRIDWSLMLVFVLMFADLGLLSRYHPLGALDLSRPGTLYLTGALLSQFISNVPAAILLAKHSSDWGIIAWGANIGAFGTVIASLANLIALRLGRQRGSLLAFHAWSLPFFALAAALGWLVLQFYR